MISILENPGAAMMISQYTIPGAENPRQMRPGSSQRGVGRFPFLLLLALTAAIVYLIGVFIPAFLSNRQMEQASSEIVRRGSLTNLKESDVRAQLQEKAREFGLPEERSVVVWRDGKKMEARINYVQSIRLPFYSYKWPVEISITDLGF